MQLIPLNDEQDSFNLDFYLSSKSDFLFAIVDQTQLDEGSLLDFKQSSKGEVSGNIKSNEGDQKSYYIALKSVSDSTDINVSLATRPEKPSPPPPPPPPPPQQQQPPQRQMQRPPQQQQPPQRQMQRPPQQQQPPQRQMQRPPQRQMQRPPQRQMQRPVQRQQQPPQRQMQRPPQKQQAKKLESSNVKLERFDSKSNLNIAIIGIVGITAVGVWYFIFRKPVQKTKNKKSLHDDVVQSIGAATLRSNLVTNPILPRPRTGLPRPRTGLPRPRTGLPLPKTGLDLPKTDLLSKLRALPSHKKSRSR